MYIWTQASSKTIQMEISDPNGFKLKPRGVFQYEEGPVTWPVVAGLSDDLVSQCGMEMT